MDLYTDQELWDHIIPSKLSSQQVEDQIFSQESYLPSNNDYEFQPGNSYSENWNYPLDELKVNSVPITTSGTGYSHSEQNEYSAPPSANTTSIQKKSKKRTSKGINSERTDKNLQTDRISFDKKVTLTLSPVPHCGHGTLEEIKCIFCTKCRMLTLCDMCFKLCQRQKGEYFCPLCPNLRLSRRTNIPLNILKGEFTDEDTNDHDIENKPRKSVKRRKKIGEKLF